MEILVCVKRVPDTAENEIEVGKDGTDIRREDLVYSVNEWDNYAVEEAIQIRDKVGGSVTVVTVGDEEAEEVLRREMAMGADNGLLLDDDAFAGGDGKGIAAILKAAVEKGQYDLVLTGAQADDGAGQIGGMLAAMLDWPYASVVNAIEVVDDKTCGSAVRSKAAIRKSTTSNCPVCCRFRPGSMSRATLAFEASAKWPRWRFHLSGHPSSGWVPMPSGRRPRRSSAWIILCRRWERAPKCWRAAPKRLPKR